MSAMNAMNISLWIVQAVLAIFFFASAIPKLAGRGLERWVGFRDQPRLQVLVTGVTEFPRQSDWFCRWPPGSWPG